MTQPLRVVPVGADAVIVEVADASAALSLALWAREGRIDAVEIVPGASTVLFDGLATGTDLETLLRPWRPDTSPVGGPEVVVPVVFDGPDLSVVADHWGVGDDAAVGRLTSLELVSAFCGFAPGFAYLAGLPVEWSVPRRAEPRARVEPGSVALADRWCGVYPTASPGGWQLVGRTDSLLWDAERTPPALLAPGTRVRFVEAS